MSPSLLFRGLLCLSVLTGIAGAAASYALRTELPPPLREYVRRRDYSAGLDGDVWLLLVAYLALFLSVLGWVGLFCFWKPARWICLGLLVLIGPLVGLMGPCVEPGWAIALESCSLMLAAAVMALSFCSPCRDLFAAPVSVRGVFGASLLTVGLILAAFSFTLHHQAMPYASRPAIVCCIVGSVLVAQALRTGA